MKEELQKQDVDIIEELGEIMQGGNLPGMIWYSDSLQGRVTTELLMSPRNTEGRVHGQHP